MHMDKLLEQAEANKKIVALDADLVLDTGLIPFQEKFPIDLLSAVLQNKIWSHKLVVWP